MTGTFLVSLLFDAAAVGLVAGRLRRQIFTHVGAVFILAAAAYHGLGEILVRLFPGRDIYRQFVPQATVDQFMLYAAGAILLMAVIYAALVRPSTFKPGEFAAGRTTSTGVFRWWLMLLVTIPLAALTVRGHGLNHTTAPGTVQTGTTATAGFAQQFLLLFMVLAGFSIVIRFGRQWLIPVLLVQSALLAYGGSRLDIVIAGAMLLAALGLYGIRVTRRQIAAGALLVLVLVVDITAARASSTHGAQTFSAGTSSSIRTGALLTGLAHTFDPATKQALEQTLGYRLDGNVFGALETQAIQQGAQPVGLAPLRAAIGNVLPSQIDPGKLNEPQDHKVIKDYIVTHMGIPALVSGENTYLDFLPTELGTVYGWFGAVGLFLIAAVLGALLAMLDRFVRARLTPARLVLLIFAFYCAVDYEGDPQAVISAARGAVLLLLAVFVLGWAWRHVLAPATVRPGPVSGAAVAPVPAFAAALGLQPVRVATRAATPSAAFRDFAIEWTEALDYDGPITVPTQVYVDPEPRWQHYLIALAWLAALGVIYAGYIPHALNIAAWILWWLISLGFILISRRGFSLRRALRRTS